MYYIYNTYNYILIKLYTYKIEEIQFSSKQQGDKIFSFIIILDIQIFLKVHVYFCFSL